MACGTPVVYSNVAACPEIVGEAGIACSPDTTDAYLDAIVSVLTDTSEAQRLRDLGCQRAKTFTWDQCAKRTVSVYRSVLGSV